MQKPLSLLKEGSGFCVSKKDFDTLHENLWIFMEKGLRKSENLRIFRAIS